MTGPKLGATGAQWKKAEKAGKRPNPKAARAMPVPVEIEYRLVRHLANSRVPFTNGYVASLIGDLPAEDSANVTNLSARIAERVERATEDAWAWGWLDRVGGQWKGRL